jgi:hypothetical protein
VSRRLLVLNVLIGLVGGLLAVALVREWLTSRPLPTPAAARPVPAAAVPAANPALPAPTGYGIIVTKNVFSPSRAEAPAGPAPAAGPKPLLHGVVMDGAKSRAYLEDPAAGRTFGYAVGDTVAGGRVQAISADRVIIARPEGRLEVLLQDPAKPRPANGAAAGAPAAGGGEAASAPQAPTPPGAPAAPGPRRAPAAAPQGGRQ